MDCTTEAGTSSEQASAELGLETRRKDIKLPKHRGNFHHIIHVLQYCVFARNVCDINEDKSKPTVPKSLVDEAWLSLCRKRLDCWNKAADWPPAKKEFELQRAMGQTTSVRALHLWAERARIAGDPSLADPSPLLDISYETLRQYEAMVVEKEEAKNETKDIDALQLEQEQAALFAQSLAKMQGLAIGDALDADGDITMD